MSKAAISSIIITNKSPNMQRFYLYQEPATYSELTTVYVNCLASQAVAAKPSGRGTSQAQLTIETGLYASIQQSSGLGHPSRAVFTTPIATAGRQTPDARNSTSLTILDDVISLSDAVPTNSLSDGTFQIITPTFDPGQYAIYAGLGNSGGGKWLLSNFIKLGPNKIINVRPCAIYHVSTGEYLPGEVINPKSVRSSAICDTATGTNTFEVTYESDGTWEIITSS